MSVLIKGMKMPKHCWQCGLKDSDDECMATYAIDRQIESVDEVWGEQRVPDWCPLVEVPTPHGRLIDADELEADTEWSERHDDYTAFSRAQINAAPTIIEAEEADS